MSNLSRWTAIVTVTIAVASFATIFVFHTAYSLKSLQKQQASQKCLTVTINNGSVFCITPDFKAVELGKAE